MDSIFFLYYPQLHFSTFLDKNILKNNSLPRKKFILGETDHFSNIHFEL